MHIPRGILIYLTDCLNALLFNCLPLFQFIVEHLYVSLFCCFPPPLICSIIDAIHSGNDLKHIECCWTMYSECLPLLECWTYQSAYTPTLKRATDQFAYIRMGANPIIYNIIYVSVATTDADASAVAVAAAAIDQFSDWLFSLVLIEEFMPFNSSRSNGFCWHFNYSLINIIQDEANIFRLAKEQQKRRESESLQSNH